MLTQLYIENFVLVEQLTINFKPGLNIFTGETGAGKTIIISALNAILGERVTIDLIRTGEERAVITGMFTIDTPSIHEILKEAGISVVGNGDELLLQREIQQNGKHICRINGRPVTLGMLSDVGRTLIDIHGQHQHQSLLSPQVQLHLLDRYGGLLELKEQVNHIYRQFTELIEELKRLSINETEKMRQMSLLSFEIDEINRAKLQLNEDDSITEEIHLLHHAQRLNTLAIKAYETLYESDGAIYSKMYQVLKNIHEIAEIDTSMQANVSEAEGCYYQIEALAFRLKEYAGKCCTDSARLEECEARLDLINNLKRKYGQDIERILFYGDEAAKRLNAITHQEEEMARIETEKQKIADILSQMASTLSQKRQEASKKLMLEVENELRELAMKHCQFLVDLRQVEKATGSRQDTRDEYLLPVISAVSADTECKEQSRPFPTAMKIFSHGFDEACFLICPNLGETARPLSDIASGGELSRIMLAIKGILAKVDEIPTLVFDEIDTGVGGKTAQMVAEKLKSIGQSHQVICITHLPMIASFADHHLYVEKKVSKENRTTTQVKPLDNTERIHEIAIMLGGGSTSGNVSEASLRHAEELIKGAHLEQINGKLLD
ncbi:MAG: DNA repair protein RecN [bacterium]|nr:DNA repair protein RecN [bacterium]